MDVALTCTLMHLNLNQIFRLRIPYLIQGLGPSPLCSFRFFLSSQTGGVIKCRFFLAAKRSAGGAPDVQATTHSTEGIDPGLKAMADVTWSPKQGYQWSHKRTQQKNKKVDIFNSVFSLNIDAARTFERIKAKSFGLVCLFIWWYLTWNTKDQYQSLWNKIFNLYTRVKKSLWRLWFDTCLSVILLMEVGAVSKGRGLYPEGVCIHGQGADPPPPSDCTGYGQWAGGTHPTGMHSCLFQEKLYFLVKAVQGLPHTELKRRWKQK